MGKHLVTAAATAGLLVTAFGASASAQELTYTVHQGDTLGKISNSTPLTVDQLKTLNHLNSDQIYVNQKLSITYTVKSGDTLWDIANTYGTTVSELKRVNGLASDLIQIGQQLQLSNSNSVKAVQASVNVNNSTTYAVQKGDTLSGIAARFHVSVPNLKAFNQLTSDTIYPGQTLKLKGMVSNITQKIVPKTSANPAAASNAKIAKSILAKSTAVEAARTTVPSHPAPAQKPAVTGPSASRTNVQAIISEAEKYIGTPYVWGGNTPSGFDCSGYLTYVFHKFGISIPRTTEAEFATLKPVSSPSVGDLVFFATYTSGPSHVGIYLGNNKFISAESNGVKISDMTYTYWKTRYLGARSAL